MQHFYPVIDTMLILQAIYPKPESRQISSYCWNVEGYTLQRSISPWFVIRSIDTQVLSQQYIILFFVHNTVTPVQIARNKYHLYLISGTITHSLIFQHIQHLVMSHVMQPMSDKPHLERSIKLLFSLLTYLQFITGI